MKMIVVYDPGKAPPYRVSYEGGDLDGQVIEFDGERLVGMIAAAEDKGEHAQAKFLAETTALARSQPGVPVKVSSD
jgi:hypothetical protein